MGNKLMLRRLLTNVCRPFVLPALSLPLVLGACSSTTDVAEQADATAQVEPSNAAVNLAQSQDAATSTGVTNLYWGDTHLHTSNSFDVYLFGTPTATPETAYRFAMGRPVVSPTTHTRWQLSTPLDFLVVADHAEAVGSIPRIFSGDPVVADTKTGRLVRQLAPDETTEQLQAVYEVLLTAASGIENEYGITARDVLEDSCALEFSWTLDCERVLAGGVSR